MREYGIKPSELVGLKRGRSPAPPRYRDPETGQTWSGRGPRLRWLEGKNSKEFLITRAEPHRKQVVEATIHESPTQTKPSVQPAPMEVKFAGG
ncbi:H-NS histone family protein [Paraburkholderia nemoris]|uniref:H-NS histone family protein n=1 Tax=Paraburkholderia nemoris TaxID=2793076 RepID=UPI0038BA4C1D